MDEPHRCTPDCRRLHALRHAIDALPPRARLPDCEASAGVAAGERALPPRYLSLYWYHECC